MQIMQSIFKDRTVQNKTNVFNLLFFWKDNDVLVSNRFSQHENWCLLYSPTKQIYRESQ